MIKQQLEVGPSSLICTITINASKNVPFHIKPESFFFFLQPSKVVYAEFALIFLFVLCTSL